jgi:hypothetical protein
MPPDNIENSIEEIIDGSKDDPEVKRCEKIKLLEGLLQTVRINRRAIEIIKALDAGDRNMAAQIAVTATREGIDSNTLKAACRAQRKK